MIDSLKISTTNDLPASIRSELIKNLGSLIPVEDDGILFQKSLDQNSIIKIIGEASSWITPFKAIVTIFLYEITKKAAQELWDKKSTIFKILKDKKFKLFSSFLHTVSDVRKKINKPSILIIGLPIPDNLVGATIDIYSNEVPDLAWNLANFIIRLERIEAKLKNELDNSRFPIGGYNINIDENGSITISFNLREGDYLKEIRISIE